MRIERDHKEESRRTHQPRGRPSLRRPAERWSALHQPAEPPATEVSDQPRLAVAASLFPGDLLNELLELSGEPTSS